MTTVDLQYGSHQQFDWALPPTGAASVHQGPDQDVALAAAVRQALQQPLDLPPVHAGILPGDRVVLAVEPNAPILAEVVAAVWDELAAAGVQAADVLILQPAELPGRPRFDPRAQLPEAVRSQVEWKIHDPTAADSCGYLASSAAGERVYLAREILDADFVLPISVAGFDPLLGYKPPGNVLYPGLSNLDAYKKTLGVAHQELQPEHDRPLRQLIHEISWLLGALYSLQVLPSTRRGQATAVLVGQPEAIFARAQVLLDEHWRVRVSERVETVVVAIPTTTHEVHWEDLGRALQAAQGLVQRGGRIIALTDLKQAAGPGVQLLKEQRSPRVALPPLRALAPEDLIPATQLATAADWAQVYLLSQLPTSDVEDLFCQPLESEAELARLLAGVEQCVVLGGAQFMHGEVTDD